MGKIVEMFSPIQKAKLHLNRMKQCPFDRETVCVDSDGNSCYREGYCNYLGLEETQRNKL